MAKNGILFILIIIIIGFGIGYSFLNDPEQPARQLVKLTLKEFAKNSVEIEEQFSTSRSLAKSVKDLTVAFTYLNEDVQVPIKMTVGNNQVVLLFSDKKSLLAGQTIILEPFTKNNVTHWYCINGNVLVRLRNRDCRIGNGILTADLLKQ